MSPSAKLSAIDGLARQPRHRVWIGAALLLGIAGTMLVFAGNGGGENEAGQLHEVRRSNMLISIVEGGTLRAAREVSIVSQVEGQTSIIYLIPEGTEVEHGDLLVELDSSELEESLTQREIAYEEALSTFTEARENLAIKRSESESEVALAELAVEFAESDQKKYNDGDWLLERRNAEAAIELAEEELKRAEERLTYTEDLADRGYATRSELEADRFTVTRREIELERAKEEKRLLSEYQRPRRLRELESDLEQARAALDRARSKAAAELSQAEATLNARKATLDLEAARLNRVKRQLDNTRIEAPQSGLVIYGTSGGREQTPIQEGDTVRQRQEILKLPDLSQMMVDVKVHESQVGQVRRGQTALVTIDALPDRRFRGRVQRISVLPDSQSRWLNPDLKVYTTEILIEDALPDINPGVSARAEIIVEQLQDVIRVPIQAVTTARGERVVFRQNGTHSEEVPVTIGMFNDTHIHVLDGLAAGDRILLSPPRRTLDEDFLPLAIGDQDQRRIAEARGEEPEEDGAEPPQLDPRSERAGPDGERSRQRGEDRRGREQQPGD